MTELHEIAAESSTALDEPLLLKLQTELKETNWSDWRCDRPTIFRVHRELREVDSKAYDPEIISFGPYHRDNKQLKVYSKAMEKLKRLYLKKFVARNPEVGLEDYVREIRQVEMRARSAYSEEIEMGQDEFVEMMLLDGCFIVELLLVLNGYDSKNEGATEFTLFEDPIRSSKWAKNRVIDDMLMLENQLPFFLLEILLKLCYPSRQFYELAVEQLIKSGHLIHSKNERNHKEIVRTSEPYHILHLFYIMATNRKEIMETNGNPQEEISIPVVPGPVENLMTKEKSCFPTEFICSNIRKIKSLLIRLKSCFLFFGEVLIVFVLYVPFNCLLFFVYLVLFVLGYRESETIRSATKLKDTGLKFKRNRAAPSFLNITFEGNVMEIPWLGLYDETNSLLRNLIALEQCYNCEDIGDDVTSYADFMDSLIDTPEDVEILQQKGIIYNALGSNEDVARLFNKMGKGVFISSNGGYLSDVIRSVKYFSNKRRNRWRAKLKKDYFSSPWAIISVLAAIFLIGLTVLQTIYTLLAYYKPPK